MQELFRVIRFYFSRIGRASFAIAKVVVVEALRNPEVVAMTDEARRKWAQDKVTNAIVEKYGENIPGLKWYVNLAIELAVGVLRGQARAYRQEHED